MRQRFLLSLALLIPAVAIAQEAPERGGRGGRDAEGAKSEKEKSGIKPYDEVVKEGFESSKGLFRVHRKSNELLFEIPQALLGVDMLWVTQIAETQAGFGYGGTSVGNRVVRWELRGEDVLLRDVKYTIRGDQHDSVQKAVEATSLAPIIEKFPIKAWGVDQSPVIDVAALFTGDLPEFSAKERLDATGVDKERTFLDSVRTFPENIETKVLMTYKLSTGSPRETPTTPPRGPRTASRRDRTQGAVTVKLHHSMVRLPELAAASREHDERVGFFSVSFEDYDADEHAVDTKRYITRWRLEKKDPSAAVSEPKQPIVFYVGREVPEKWRPWVHKGIEMWQPAFEAAGFSKAIVAKDPPDPREDPDWDAEDARYSSIRWLPATIENAMGPHVHDPRTGEILEADIIMYHNVVKLVRDWYFVQASPNDPRAQQLPLPDDLVGEALAYVVAHEVGHSLGFPHNMKASSSFSVDQLRDAEFTAKNGTEASIMDYGRFNYVAQPGDNARLIPTIGPYDFFAVEWGYKQYDTPAAEKEGLATLVTKQVADPTLRFGDPNAGEDPSQQTEDLGSDPILATTLGLLNIDRVAGYLVKATCKEGEDYELLSNMYDELLAQRDRELGHVASMVGGFVEKNLWFGDAERRFEPMPAGRQREAVQFLHQNAFLTPRGLIDDDILSRLESSGAPDRILRGQQRLLSSLLAESRIDRMAEHADRAEGEAYLPVDLMKDISKGLWSELESSPVDVDLYRRNLQRAHIEVLAEKLKSNEEGTPPNSDLPALARGELALLLDAVTAALEGPVEETTRLHLADIQARIREHLNPLLERALDRGVVPASAPNPERR